MDKKYQDTGLDESIEIQKAFKVIGENIMGELENKIKNFNNSFLYRNYSNFFYFIPKHNLLEINGGSHNGYHIAPDQPFFVEDKKKGVSLKYTTRLETNLASVRSIKTKLNNNYFIVDIDFDCSFEYEKFTLWLSPEFVMTDKFLAHSILRKILASNSSEVFAEVFYKDNLKSTKRVHLSTLNYQLKPIETDALSYHSPQMTCGFNVYVEDLFNYEYNEIRKISLFIKNNSKSFVEEKVENLFKINMIPIFNSYDGYSRASYVNKQMSEEILVNDKNHYAKPLSILAVYENNKKINFDNFIFKGDNEYYFNIKKQILSYNVQLPSLETHIKDVRVYTYGAWTDNLDLSNSIIISSNELSSLSCNILPKHIGNEHTNYKTPSTKIFSLVEKLGVKEVFNKSIIIDLLTLLRVNDSDIELLLTAINEINFERVTEIIYIYIKPKFLKQYSELLEFMIAVLCKFINRNTFINIKDFFLIDIDNKR